ncbi:hypothetical protein HID58_095304 [Brassica napus]|uniref:Uncharacterized protein n=1 Tax=Brassica napus TaxID=3708 RepID=A0ABQ7X487_BRANA|nr:hypothetical protein HID58_095304 [Brassica napus]
MKERQRWTGEEDALLRAYVRQFGPREWHLVSDRMNKPLNRDAKSCLERWKNYLKPGIKKGSLTEEEQRLVIRLQEKHGKSGRRSPPRFPEDGEAVREVVGSVQGEAAERGEESNKRVEPIDESKYDRILESFAEKLVKERSVSVPMAMAAASPQPPIPWLQQPERGETHVLGSMIPSCSGGNESVFMSELMECCRELEEGHRAWAEHKKEAAWRLRRLELQLESEKTSRQREKMEEIEAKMKALRESRRWQWRRLKESIENSLWA